MSEKLIDYVATVDALRAKVEALEQELESHAWEISPAMAQAKLDELNAKIEALKQENARLNTIEDAVGEAAFTLQDQLATMTQERDDLKAQVFKQYDKEETLTHERDDLERKLREVCLAHGPLLEALRFYADPQTYGINGGSVDRIIQDGGKQANAALRGETGVA
jgi:chromosome segregation ATPase